MGKHCIVFCYNVPFTPDPASLTTLTLYQINYTIGVDFSKLN